MLVALMTASLSQAARTFPLLMTSPTAATAARPLLRWLRVTEPLTLPTIL